MLRKGGRYKEIDMCSERLTNSRDSKEPDFFQSEEA
jgi:hypothetical protein